MAERAALSVVRSDGEWLPLRLPTGVDREFAVFGSDLSSTARAFNPEALDWLLMRLDVLPTLAGMFLSLTFENGLVYCTMRAARPDAEPATQTPGG